MFGGHRGNMTLYLSSALTPRDTWGRIPRSQKIKLGPDEHIFSESGIVVKLPPAVFEVKTSDQEVG